MRVLSLCSGIGGLELGLQLVGVPVDECIYVEPDPYAAAVLVARMEEGSMAPGDVVVAGVERLEPRRLRDIDIVAAGFPCQPFSSASRGRKVARDLWPDVRTVIGYAAPRWVFCENVARRPIERAGRELAHAGYHCRMARLSAAQVGAPHERPRWWLFADADDESESALPVHAEVAGIREAARARWEESPSGILGMDDGLPGRMDRLRCLGNACNPYQVAAAWTALSPTKENP